ncbi:MAG: hypothetical protein FD164_287 [Nitrospirae bacterium]|nr:MAG: hypothetical protein FD164_287 [Nitrospirota bacterium]
MHDIRYILLPAVIFVPLTALAYWQGQDFGQIGLHLISLTVMLFLILIWFMRARAECRRGLKLRAAFSAAVVLFLLALLYQLVRIPLGALFASDSTTPSISETIRK